MSIPGARRGLMLVLSSPSGAGKTTMTKRLLATDPQISLSVSATTRKARAGEIHGQDYSFVSHDEFDRLVATGKLLEWAHVFGNRYGTPRGPVENALTEGRDILFDIDWQGTQQLRQSQSGGDLVSIFLLPPSLEELESRLTSRAADSADVITQRMSRAADEISHWAEYDYILVNDDPGQCLHEIRSILTTERLRRERQRGLAGFVRDLLTGS
ncbi:guanylate kinase [Sandaracinobacteroides hominis]|uniref:guanylate kinase n=1 Tax=Sandaracinobacteroides hominis TaxID=2780086 RepID=UPI0018F2DFBA|nr:guanylate kinase [Sandaracinobacteroides hominis]